MMYDGIGMVVKAIGAYTINVPGFPAAASSRGEASCWQRRYRRESKTRKR